MSHRRGWKRLKIGSGMVDYGIQDKHRQFANPAMASALEQAGVCRIHNDANPAEDFDEVDVRQDPRERSDTLGITHPEQVELDYFDLLASRIDEIERAIRQTVGKKLQSIESSLNRRADSKQRDIETIDREFSKLRLRVGERNPVPQEKVDGIASAVDAHNRNEVKRDFQRIAKVNPLLDDAGLRQRFKEFSRQNANLIQDLDDEALSRVESRVREGIQSGERYETVAKSISEQTNIAKSRAKLIARDQTSKLNSDLNRVRQRKNGIRRYEWMSASDSRVRDSHVDLHRTIRRWDNPHPTEGHPGDAVNCRCVSRGIVKDVLNDLEGTRDREVSPIAPGFDQPGKMRFRDRRQSYKPSWPVDGKAQFVQEAWVHGSWNKTGVQFKEAARREFDFGDRAVWNPRGHDLSDEVSQNRVDDMQNVARHQYQKAQKSLERRGIDEIELYRGVNADEDVEGVVESWTQSKEVAQSFAGDDGHVMVEDVPKERVLMFRDGPNWQDGRYGNQEEFVLLPEPPQ